LAEALMTTTTKNTKGATKNTEVAKGATKGRFLRVGLLLAVLAVLALGTVVASANGTTIDWWALSGGGGGASGGGVTLDSTLGQPIAGVSNNTGTWLGAGYWYAEQPRQIFLPMIQK